MRPLADPTQAAGPRLIANSLQGSSLSPSPLSVPGSLPSPLTSAGPRPVNALSNPGQSKLATVANGTSALKLPGGAQGTSSQSTQENSQDKQAEQAKLVRS